MIIPDHILKCHPFVGSSFLDVTQSEEDDEERDKSSTNEDTEDHPVSTEETISIVTATGADRRSAFVVDDRAEAGPTAR